MPTTTTSVRRWKPTVGSHVLAGLEARHADGEETGVKRLSRAYVETATGVSWSVRIMATPAGFELVKALVDEARKGPRYLV